MRRSILPREIRVFPKRSIDLMLNRPDCEGRSGREKPGNGSRYLRRLDVNLTCIDKPGINQLKATKRSYET